MMSVPMAIALSGQLFLGQPVMVKPSEAEKNLAQSNSTTVGGTGPADRKLYVGNLHFNMSELQLRQVIFSFLGQLFNYIWTLQQLFFFLSVSFIFSQLFPFLYQIFEAFGPVELVQLPLDPETGQCKGFGFIQVSGTCFLLCWYSFS